jgi:CBS domain-containing protein
MKINECNLVGVFSCSKSASIVEVAKLMRDHKQRHIIVVDSGKPVGMISNVDIINKVVAASKDTVKEIAANIMVSPVDTVDLNDEVSDAYFKMASRNTFSCPVTENGKLKSLLTFNEALKSMIQTKGVDQNGQTI